MWCRCAPAGLDIEGGSQGLLVVQDVGKAYLDIGVVNVGIHVEVVHFDIKAATLHLHAYQFGHFAALSFGGESQRHIQLRGVGMDAVVGDIELAEPHSAGGLDLFESHIGQRGETAFGRQVDLCGAVHIKWHGIRQEALQVGHLHLALDVGVHQHVAH